VCRNCVTSLLVVSVLYKSVPFLCGSKARTSDLSRCGEVPNYWTSYRRCGTVLPNKFCPAVRFEGSNLGPLALWRGP